MKCLRTWPALPKWSQLAQKLRYSLQTWCWMPSMIGFQHTKRSTFYDVCGQHNYSWKCVTFEAGRSLDSQLWVLIHAYPPGLRNRLCPHIFPKNIHQISLTSTIQRFRVDKWSQIASKDLKINRARDIKHGYPICKNSSIAIHKNCVL